MNLLHIISSMNPSTGGPCQGIINLHNGLNALGVNQEIVSLDNPSADYVTKSSLTIHALGNPSSKWQYNKQFSPWLQANSYRFDVIVLHGLWLYLGFATWKVLSTHARKRGATNQAIPRFFIVPHGMLDPWFQKDARRWLKAIRNAAYWHLIERNIINNADGLLFTCETELLLAKEAFRHYTPKLEINVGYGIMPPPRFRQSTSKAFYDRFPQLKNERYLLFLGRIHMKKGVDLLIDAYERLVKAEELTDSTIPKLVIAGPGLETAYGKRVQQLVKKSPLLATNITFTGMIVDEVKWGAFYNAEAFILPSYQENFGIAVVESLACGKAVLISDQVNIWREIAENRAGFVFKNSANEVKQAMLHFLSMSKQDKEEIDKRALATFNNVFSVEPVIKKFVQAISV